MLDIDASCCDVNKPAYIANERANMYTRYVGKEYYPYPRGCPGAAPGCCMHAAYLPLHLKMPRAGIAAKDPAAILRLSSYQCVARTPSAHRLYPTYPSLGTSVSGSYPTEPRTIHADGSY